MESDPLHWSLFSIPKWFKASVDGSAEVCHSRKRDLTLCHHCLWVSQSWITHSFVFEVCVPGGMRLLLLHRQTSDTGKQLGETLKPVALWFQWIKWWSIHTGQDAATLQFNPCSQAIRARAIPQCSLLFAACSHWYCSLGNDYHAIKTNVHSISPVLLEKL